MLIHIKLHTQARLLAPHQEAVAQVMLIIKLQLDLLHPHLVMDGAQKHGEQAPGILLDRDWETLYVLAST